MKPEIKVIHVEEKVAKNGNKYSVIWVAIFINEKSFVKKVTMF